MRRTNETDELQGTISDILYELDVLTHLARKGVHVAGAPKVPTHARPLTRLERTVPTPLVVLISGPRAAGKSTLGRRLAQALALPLLSRDALKECLADALGAATYEDGARLGVAANALFETLGLELGRTGAGVVMEGWLQRGRSEAWLATARQCATDTRQLTAKRMPPRTFAKGNCRRWRGSRRPP